MKIGDMAQHTVIRTAGDATIVVGGEEPGRYDRSKAKGSLSAGFRA
jgi:hypothetical protein